MGKKLLKYLRNVAIIALSLYLLVCGLMYVFQDSLLFHPQPKSIAQTSAFLKQHPDFDTLRLAMEDQTPVSVFISKADSGQAKQPLVIYFGGNAEEVSHLAEYKDHFKPCVLALANYRGFGRSAGQPSEKTMFSDALAIYDQLKMLPGIDPGCIIIVGRSIGTGVATYLSSKRPVKATILITPYESMISVAQEKYPFVPIAPLIRHRFESEIYAASITTPVLALIAQKDIVIPPPHAYALLKCWKGKNESLEVNADHHSIMANEEVWKKVEEFITIQTK